MKRNAPLNWGIIGPGIIAERMARALEITSGNRLIAAASKSPDRARRFAGKFHSVKACTYQEIVNDPAIDVIYVATTHNFHFENARLALGHGKHVLMEKPFTVNACEAKELMRIAREKGLFLMEALWTRFLPGVVRMKQILSEGGIGEVRQVNISFGGFVTPEYEKRLNDPSLAGGVTLDMGIYAISFICYLLGERPIKTASMCRFNDLGVDEHADYLFRFPSGCLAMVSTSFNLKMANEASIYGTRGFVRFPEFPGGDRFSLCLHHGTNEVTETSEIAEPHEENGFVYQVREVHRCIARRDTESRIIPMEETVEIMEVMDRMRETWGLRYPSEAE